MERQTVAICRIGHDLAEHPEDVADALVAQLGACAAGFVGELGAEGEDVGLGDARHRTLAEC